MLRKQKAKWLNYSLSNKMIIITSIIFILGVVFILLDGFFHVIDINITVSIFALAFSAIAILITVHLVDVTSEESKKERHIEYISPSENSDVLKNNLSSTLKKLNGNIIDSVNIVDSKDGKKEVFIIYH